MDQAIGRTPKILSTADYKENSLRLKEREKDKRVRNNVEKALDLTGLQCCFNRNFIYQNNVSITYRSVVQSFIFIILKHVTLNIYLSFCLSDCPSARLQLYTDGEYDVILCYLYNAMALSEIYSD